MPPMVLRSSAAQPADTFPFLRWDALAAARPAARSVRLACFSSLVDFLPVAAEP